MSKRLYFFPSMKDLICLETADPALFSSATICWTYNDTSQAIKDNVGVIFTVVPNFLSFDIADLGYELWICHDLKKLHLREGMEEIDKEIRHCHDLMRIAVGGGFDKCFNTPLFSKRDTE